MKGVSIPINTLVMLAVAIIVLLAAVAWFMGAFSPAASSASYKQNFDTSCMQWVNTNCGGPIPRNTCLAYRNMTGSTIACTTNPTNIGYINIIAPACGCVQPYGQGQ